MKNWHAVGGSCDDMCLFSCDENKMAKARWSDTCGKNKSTKSAFYLFYAQRKRK